MISAGEALRQAATAALGQVAGLGGLYPGTPIQAAFPHALVEAGPETDWSHKSGAGREVRLAATLWDKGERAARLRALAAEADAALAALGGEMGGWRLVTMTFVRSRIVQDRKGGWAAIIEYRARMSALDPS